MIILTNRYTYNTKNYKWTILREPDLWAFILAFAGVTGGTGGGGAALSSRESGTSLSVTFRPNGPAFAGVTGSGAGVGVARG